MNKHDFNQLAQSARTANLADYFMRSGYTTERCGRQIKVKDFGGLWVHMDTNQWYCHSTQVGGNNAIDCLTKMLNHDFKQAVYELTGRDVSETTSKSYPKEIRPLYTSPPQVYAAPEPKKEFALPARDENMRRVFAYFCKERRIPAGIVEELAHAKLLYQSNEEGQSEVNGIMQTFKKCNAIFVHMNENGDAVGGEVQGVNSFKRYKGVLAGTSDSAFMFTPTPAKEGEQRRAYLFESAIDLMSFYMFCKPEKMKGVTLVSMAGLKPSVGRKLEAEGVKVFSCVDNDEDGRGFEQRNGFNRLTDMLEKANVKDWNDLILLKLENPEAVKDFTPDIIKTDKTEKKNLFNFPKPGGRKA